MTTHAPSTNGSGTPETSARAAGLPPEDGLATFLGLFSAGLGVPQVASPGSVNRAIGVRDDDRARIWQRVVGVRELAAAAGILSQRRPVGWLWARVAGDAMDLALLVAALRKKDADPTRIMAAIGAVAGVSVADVIETLRMSGRTEPADEAAETRRITTAITIRSSREELYRFWRDLENLPSFMIHLESVEARGSGRSHWKAKGPVGKSVEWDAEVTEDRPSELIAWRSVPGAGVQHAGSVRFTTAPGDRGTEVHLDLRYAPPGGALGATAAKLLGEEPEVQVKDDLRRLKQLMETGEVVRSEGSPEGTMARRLVKQRPAQPMPAGRAS